MSSGTSNTVSSGPILTVQLLFLGVLFVSQSQNMDTARTWAVIVARYLVYLLTARAVHEACEIIFKSLNSKAIVLANLFNQYLYSWLVFGTSVAVLVSSSQKVIGEEFPLFFAALLVVRYLDMERKAPPTINYGTGMACSFFEGYLSLIIPSDGASCDNFVEKVRQLESSQGVKYPVKKLLLVITKSLFCPPDLKHYNKPDRHDLPQIEACTSLQEVKKDVAGVKDRLYRNTAYKIFWPDHSQAPVYIMAECATPLHTLYKVLEKRKLYEELCDVDVPMLVSDFCQQLEKIIARSPDCRGNCELVYFDDTPSSEEYLPSVLLAKIAQLEPDYQHIIARYAADNPPDELDLPLPPEH